ncbi:50S ribosomal protein L24 [Candidatus Daviesbacteria bacterium RIFCSPLOWO2_01_FULL_43_38]|uniref:Large ribosomal subunit protein uL24 n=3 Tax=Candidatus Daviesiibacteriota TaxID=1752718 RepID=A0A1F5K7U7_9BACT|nr:MAG: 50S ribosomal protein L24 [Candidatus Daviesbacteria bacterium GW2011_GWA1_42_6]KKS71325.1 MAG: 50S ribosomal protein L24 [Candidatus Daviesbacteria bacterium GW2011_GWA2_42_7]OGE20410.1 MAG: 50S ribosomal protein L24 [Candidatus Daviesbacteria bacterium RIFCSPHIGHO2_01_FULL_43_17]OGE37016.1 MAG: 50S ribosomal protein L24 [Candidatus Daviesbacteria bacterium RIFCSPHIGHO2_12_FULL_43_11]OGE63916.1 MAG: 50S ribosomal protein L24 [Candidatus Daviesbacteria bacterium RIFCSPLOWO2_01_FULL_43_3
MKIKKNDTVQILLGKDRGKNGKVLRVSTKENKVWVEGLNMYKRHVKKVGQTEGGIIGISKPLNISNVALVCPHCKKPARVGFQVEGDIKVRVCKKCKEAIK